MFTYCFDNLHPPEAHALFAEGVAYHVVFAWIVAVVVLVPYRWFAGSSLVGAVKETVLETCCRVALRIVTAEVLVILLAYLFFLLFLGPVGLWESAWACGHRCPEFYTYFAPFVISLMRRTFWLAMAWVPAVAALKRAKGFIVT